MAIGERLLANIHRGVNPTALASDTADVQGVAAQTGLRLTGWSIKEDAASAAVVILRHGTSTAGTPIAVVTLASGGSDHAEYGDVGVDVASGIFVDRVSGTTTVVLLTKIVR